MKKSFKILLLLQIVGMTLFSSCDFNNGLFTPKEGTVKNAINLTVDKWTKGEIVKLKSEKTDEQWFKFVAASSTQRLYVKLNTLTNLNAYLYDSSSELVGNYLNVSGSTGNVGYSDWFLNVGETYYIKVTGKYSDNVGTYWIGFTSFPAQPETVVTTLDENIWTNGNIVSTNSGGTGEQWFSFTATASAQYLYVKFSTCTDLYVYVYDSNYNQIGNRWNPYASYGQGAGTVKSNSLSLVYGQTYYIKTNGGTGKYWIGFTEFPAAPETIVTKLVADSWIDGNIVSQSSGGTGEQWFCFTATASLQYLYVKFSTCTDFYVYVYDNNYNQIGTCWNPYASYGQGAGTIKSNSLSFVPNQTYYIKADGGIGTYWITFNSSGVEPQ